MKYLFLMILCASAQASDSATVKLAIGQSQSVSGFTNGMDTQFYPLLSVQINSAGSTAVGVYNFEVSNDPVLDSRSSNQSANVVNWTTFPGTSQAINGIGSSVFNFADFGYHWIRVKYTAASGGSTFDVNVDAKKY